MQSFTIHSPLMVFDTVHRRTGTILRNCLFTNQKAENLEIEINYDFPEHSWVQIYGVAPRGSPPQNGGGLMLHPGENQVLLSLNTDNFNFPDHSFKGRITFLDKGEVASRDSIEINFEDVQDLEPFQGYAAIDLGTSSSTLALYHIQRDAVSRAPWTPLLHGAENSVPSAVFIRNFPKFSRRADGGSLVGEDALRAASAGSPRDPRCLQLAAKGLVGLSRVLATDEKGTGGFVDPLDVLYPLGRFVRERCQNNPRVQALLRKVIVTYPPTWNYRQLSRWRELFRRLGFRDEELDFSLDEASAAGLFYIYNCLKERDSFQKLIQDLLESEVDLTGGGKRGKGYTLNLLSLDFGGGSMDLALLEAKLELLQKTVRLRLGLLGSDSSEFGGDQVTLAVFRILKRRLAMSLCDPSRMHEERMQGAAAKKPPEPPPAPLPAPRLVGLRRSHAPSFVLPDAASLPRYFLAGWTNGHDRPDPHREVLRQNWGYLSTHIAEPHLERELEEAVEAFFPTRFLPSENEIFRLEARRSFDWLWQQAEWLKRRLFNAVNREHGKESFPSFDCLKRFRLGISLRGVPDRKVEDTIPWAGEPAAESILSVGADEVFQAISGPLEAAMAKVRKLALGKRVDRVALSGQSCRIPLVRWMLARPRNEGGLGIPPAKIDFDEENAKAAVSKGACLLHVMRETLVGFEIDIADFKANLLSELFYLEVDGSRRVLFKAGSIDDLSYFEETPETRSFPKYLSVFCGSEDTLIGQFLFDGDGEQLPLSRARSEEPGAEGDIPPHQDLLQMREKDRPRYARLATAVLKWPDRERIAWMERTAAPGAPDRPIYRYYLTRNHGFFAVRDAGEGMKWLHAIKPGEGARLGQSPEENPFSGIH